jgi:hypothetical protein
VLGGGVVTATGRVGHLTALQFDVVSYSYAGEAKNEKVPATWWKYWVKVVGKAIEEGKQPLLAIKPTNEEDAKVWGRPVPNLHIIAQARHEELLDIEKAVREGREPILVDAPTPVAPKLVATQPVVFRPFPKEEQLGRTAKKGRSR